MDIDVTALSDDELRDQVTTWAGRVAAGDAVLLQLIGEVDHREAWAMHGVLSCAHWVAWRLGLTATTAREKVRVARALRGLPVVTKVFGEGRLSYTQVRAITRVASPEDETSWVELARNATAEQLQKAASGVQQSRSREEQAADPEKHAWQTRPRVRYLDDGSAVFSFTVPPEHVPVVEAALDQACAQLQRERDASAEAPEGCADVEPVESPASAEAPPEPEPWEHEEPPYPLTTAQLEGLDEVTAEDHAAVDAYWVEHCRRRDKVHAWRAHLERLQALAPEATAPTWNDALVRLLTRPGGKAATVQLLVDPASGWARTARDQMMDPETLARCLRDLPARLRARPVALDVFDLGRKTHTVSPRLRELLGHVDGERCRIPGCGRRRKLHAHHVVFWSLGGRTDLSNLVLVCSRHHTLIHRDGWRLILHPDRRLEVRTGDGLLQATPPTLNGEPDKLPDGITPDTLPTQWTGERMDLGYVVNVFMQRAA